MILLFAALLPALAGPGDAGGAIKLDTPGVQYRMNEASATRSPWIDANGWKILRNPAARYYYDVPARSAALAAAEAYVYGAHAAVHTDGTSGFNSMLEFLRGIPDAGLPVLANIGIVDDGSDEAGELMNLLSRRNLLYRIVKTADATLDLNVRLGSKEYPKAEAADPNLLAHKVRSQLTDEKRLLRLFGSEVVIGRALGNREHARIHLLNYANRPVIGLRVRIRGAYSSAKVLVFNRPAVQLQDFESVNGATEFTVPEMESYAVIDLSR